MPINFKTVITDYVLILLQGRLQDTVTEYSPLKHMWLTRLQ